MYDIFQDMKIRTTWDLSSLGSKINDPAFLKERAQTEKASRAFEKKWKGNKKYLTNIKVLREALDDYEKLMADEGKEDRYLWLRSCLETQNMEIQAAMTLLQDFNNKISDYIRFFGLSLGTISPSNQKKFLKAKELEPYRNYLKGIFDSAKYFLSEKEEKILSMKSSVSSGNWVMMIEEFLSSEEREVVVKNDNGKYEKRKLSLDEIFKNTRINDPKILNSSIPALNDILKSNEKVAEKEINSFLENKKIDDELRGFKRPDSSRHNAEDIDTKAVDTLVEVVEKNFKVSRDFYTLKTQLLKRKKLSYAERSVQYGTVTQRFDYKNAVKIVDNGLAQISPEFSEIFRSFSENGQIDAFPRVGKIGSAFCVQGYKQNVMILLNHTDTFRDVATLAHEMGHGVHAVKARGENALNYNVPMCTAEVASTFCEDFIVDELQKNVVSDEDVLTLLVSRLENKITTIFRQIAAYRFEQELHAEFRKKGYLTKKEIGALFNKHMKAYMGSSVTFDDDSGRGWIYWSHFRSSFYVFAYSMALLVAQFARKKFLEDPTYLEKINEFYSTGSSLSPAEIFKNLGLDVNNPDSWQEGIDEIKDLLKEAKKLAKKLGKI